MSHKEVYAAISSVSLGDSTLPCAHIAWREGSAPSTLPWAVYYLDEETSFDCDNTRYCAVRRWTVELYQKARDGELEAALEAAIVDNFSPFDKAESWVENENCLMTSYYFTEVERNTQNGQQS